MGSTSVVLSKEFAPRNLITATSPDGAAGINDPNHYRHSPNPPAEAFVLAAESVDVLDYS